MAAADTLFRRITDYANRADPYPLYAELRDHGVARQDDGSYLVGTYHEVAALLHDPRISSDRRNRTIPDEMQGSVPVAFIGRDDPEHERLRNIAMRPFGPPHAPDRVDAMHDEIARITGELVDGLRGRDRIDLVEDFAYPLPVTVICRLLGVPREDEPRFHAWSETLIAGFDPTPDSDPTERQRAATQARMEMGLYLGELAESRRGKPSDDMLSAFVNDPGPSGGFTQTELMATAVLLLIAGHETTVNLITNGVLTLLRQPESLELLRDKPELMPRAVEELLRYEPPVQLLPQRTALTDIEVAGVTVPKGAPLILVLAAANRDPLRFREPDRFDPNRPDNQHLGFGSGVHSCFGAPLARVEAQLALTALIHRLDGPRLLQDPPEYRRSPVLRGPRHLPLALSGVRD
ncbi:cytochrome P450 [Kitasatospora sp. NPDC087271]|uniref:cytochrome P450 n=1 Tax=Kitasatospora sp. NPDC087271 TaxID=3364067 RepID=UPI003801BC25